MTSLRMLGSFLFKQLCYSQFLIKTVSVFFVLPLSIHLWGIQSGLLVHGLNPVDKSLENVGHVFQGAHVQHRKNVRVLVIVGAHQ